MENIRESSIALKRSAICVLQLVITIVISGYIKSNVLDSCVINSKL